MLELAARHRGRMLNLDVGALFMNGERPGSLEQRCRAATGRAPQDVRRRHAA